MNNLVIETGKKCFQDEAKALMEIVPRIGEDFEKAVDLIYNCKGRFIITGVGKSGHIGRKIAATLASTGTPSFFVNPLDAFHGDLGMFTANDVVMAISYSGNTEELLRFIPLLKERNIPIIGVSGNPESLLGKNSDCHLNIHVDREACPLNLAPTTSTTVTLAMGDAIACALMKERDFKAEDFALFHPGGSLGKRLLTRVCDVMTKDNLPFVRLNESFANVINKMSEGKKGLVAVIDNESIVGIITDGDLRRTMQKHAERSFYLKVEEYMSYNPKLIKNETKLEEALQIMLKNSIHSLLVVDNDNKYVGIIDYFACL